MTDSEFVRHSHVRSPTALNNGACQTPECEYSCRLKRREEQLAAIRGLHQRLWAYLIVVGGAGLVVAYVTLSSKLIPSLWILLPVGMVLYILQALSKNARTHSTVQRIVKFYELGVARLSQQWKGLGIDGKEFLPADHVYASDLDLFGSGSLFELLCTARTGIGRATLARWVLAPAESGEAIERQRAVAELRDDLDLREEWASAGGGGLDRVGSSAVRDWADAPAVSFPFFGRALAIVLPICLIVSSILSRRDSRPELALRNRRSRRVGTALGSDSSEEIKARRGQSRVAFVRAWTACSLVGAHGNRALPVPIAEIAPVAAYVFVDPPFEADSNIGRMGLANQSARE